MISTSIIYQSVFQLKQIWTQLVFVLPNLPRQVHVESRGKFLLSTFLPFHPPLVFLSLLILRCVGKIQSCINLTKFVSDLRCLPVPMQSKAANKSWSWAYVGLLKQFTCMYSSALLASEYLSFQATVMAVDCTGQFTVLGSWVILPCLNILGLSLMYGYFNVVIH